MFEQMLKEYTIKNNSGIIIKVMNYGGIITDIITPDKNGNYENIALKYNTIERYEDNPLYLGAIIGRTGGRISMSRFDMDGVTYILENNHETNNLHGGYNGFDKRFWNVEEIEQGLRLKLFSEDGDSGFPGNIEVKVEYILNDDDEFHIIYEGTTDEKTVLNLTNHTYFNLGDDLMDHKLRIDADSVMDINEIFAPSGETVHIKGTAFDFSELKPIGKDIKDNLKLLKQCNGYDHAFILNHEKEYDIELICEASGRRLRVKTDKEVSVVYTMNFDEDFLYRLEEAGIPRGIAIEPQSPPDGINHDGFESAIIDVDKPYRQHTIYKFDVV